VLLRGAGLVAGLILLGAVHLRHRPATVCPLRALTGLPCPFCGGTTAAADLGRGRLGAAFLASPLALALAAALPVARTPWRPPWWGRPALRRVVVVGVLVAAELWQLVRFGLLKV
jgi:hypothetical protein